MWEGALPVVATYRVHINPPIGSPPQPRLYRENPNAPAVDPQAKGVRDAVVFLRGIDATRGKPWDLPPVRIEMRDRRFAVLQGKSSSLIGFVRRGDRVEMVSREARFHSLHAGGAAFFTVPFADANQIAARPLRRKGPVELTSASGYYWMRAHLFVDDHPYYARTGPDGSYALEKVPPGRYELVCWLPEWHEARRERDPESGQITRVYFGHPVEIVKPVTVETGKETGLSFHFKTSDFGPR
jgi:hypothetical protein